MRTTRVPVLAVLSVGLLFPFSSGCGKDTLERTAKEEGKQVDVATGEDEPTVTSKRSTASSRADGVAVTTDEGSMGIGAGTSLTAKFPKDVPVYHGATVVRSRVMGEMAMAILETGDPFAKAVASYEKECPGNGWTEVGSVTGTSGDPLRVLNYRKGKRSLMVSINGDPKKGKTIISLTVSTG